MDSTTTNWSKPTRYIACVGLTLFGIFILYLRRQVIPMLVVAGLIALIIRPIILWLQNQIHLPRLLAVGLVYLALTIMVPLIIVLAMPAILDAGQSLRNLDYATLIQNAITWLRSTVQAFKALPVPVEGLTSISIGMPITSSLRWDNLQFQDRREYLYTQFGNRLVMC